MPARQPAGSCDQSRLHVTVRVHLHISACCRLSLPLSSMFRAVLPFEPAPASKGFCLIASAIGDLRAAEVPKGAGLPVSMPRLHSAAWAGLGGLLAGS